LSPAWAAALAGFDPRYARVVAIRRGDEIEDHLMEFGEVEVEVGIEVTAPSSAAPWRPIRRGVGPVHPSGFGHSNRSQRAMS
jgi:hypothetical protein